MSESLSQFPSRTTSFQNPDGSINSMWYRFLFAQWKKTGGGTSTATIPGSVRKTGDVMTGPLILAADPTLNAGAATKHYVDLATGGIAGKVNRSGDTMTGPLLLAGVPTTPLEAADKGYVDTGDGLRLLKAGDTMTGPLLLSGAPASALHAADKAYVDAATVAPSATLPAPVGVAAIGAGTTYARADHVHALNTLAPPPVASLTAVTATVETALWVAATYSPIAANLATPGKIFRVTAGGIMSFAATGTLTITPRFGLTVGAGVTMGASNALTSPGTTTNQPWRLQFDVVVRTVGVGATSTVIGAGQFVSNGLGVAGTGVALAFGGTQATVDVTVATGITIGWTLSVAGTVTPQYVFLEALN